MQTWSPEFESLDLVNWASVTPVLRWGNGGRRMSRSFWFSYSAIYSTDQQDGRQELTPEGILCHSSPWHTHVSTQTHHLHLCTWTNRSRKVQWGQKVGESVSGLVDFLYPKREPQMHRQFLPTVSAQDQGVSTAGFSEALSLNLDSIFLYSDTHHLGEGSPLWSSVR